VSVTGVLADDLYLTLHDPYTGRSRLPEGQLSTCLAAGLLCELMLDGRVYLAGGVLAPTEGAAPQDQLARDLVHRLSPRQPLSVADWLPALRPTAVELVAGRLLRSGLVVVASRRRLGRGSVLVAVDPGRHQGNTDRLAAYLRNGITPNMSDTVLAALVMIGGAKPDPVAPSGPARALLAGLVPSLPADLQQVLVRAERVLGGRLLSVGRG
jgi:hypothetical protein